ncbi:MAG TPA: glycosyltransferase, partial [Thermoplasmata archaeon]|nr:glycosyltransferase [Thermoplasmata archaeon]
MRIVMVSAHYELLDGRIFHHEARAAVAAGHEVVLVHWDRKGGGDREEKTVDGVRTISLPIPIRGNLLSKAVRFRGIRKTLAEEVVRQRPDLVHCHDLETLPIGVDVKRELGVPLLYDAHEDYPAMVAMTNRVAARAFARLESRLLARVDRVVTVNEILREKYAKRQPTTVVANFPQRSLSETRPTPRDRALAGKIVVVYVGG